MDIDRLRAYRIRLLERGKLLEAKTVAYCIRLLQEKSPEGL